MNKISVTAVIAIGAAFSIAQAQDFCRTAAHSGNKVTLSTNKVGSFDNGIGYELWNEGGNGGSATFYDDGSFSCDMTGAKDYLCRSGLSFNSDKTHTEIGHMLADFKLVKSNLKGIDYSYIGIYGWTREPLVEWYIVDNTGSQYMPGDWVAQGSSAKKHGTFTIDGAEYTVYEGDRTSYSIDGDNKYFKQYFSVRKSPRDCGTIDISAHFKKWEELGLKMGKMHEAKILGEAGSTSGANARGSYDFPYAKVYIESSEPFEGIAQIQSVNRDRAYSVFDMQGRFMCTLEQKAGMPLNDLVKAGVKKAGSYIVKGGAGTSVVTIK